MVLFSMGRRAKSMREDIGKEPEGVHRENHGMPGEVSQPLPQGNGFSDKERVFLIIAHIPVFPEITNL